MIRTVCLALAASAATLAHAQEDGAGGAQPLLLPVRGADGQVKFAVAADGGMVAQGTVAAPRVDASESVVAPTVSAGNRLTIGETDVAVTFEANAAERAAIQQSVDKLEADSAVNALAEEEQNKRIETIEQDAAQNSAADAELAERVSKVEAENAMDAQAEAEQVAKIAEMERAWEEKLAAAETTFNEKFAALEATSKEQHASQQKVINHLVKIMARFDVSGELDSLQASANEAGTGL